MDAAGVEKSVLVQASTCYGHDNSYVADAVAAHPDRFTGVFSADVLAPDATQRMRHWMGKGLTGMRLFTTGSTMPDQADWLDDPRCFPAWELAQSAKLPVCLQMTAKAIPQLVALLDRFPRVRVILDHCARPHYEDGPPYLAARKPLGSQAARERVPEDHAAQFPRRAQRRGDARDLLQEADRANSARSASPGARISRRTRAR